MVECSAYFSQVCGFHPWEASTYKTGLMTMLWVLGTLFLGDDPLSWACLQGEGDLGAIRCMVGLG